MTYRISCTISKPMKRNDSDACNSSSGLVHTNNCWFMVNMNGLSILLWSSRTECTSALLFSADESCEYLQMASIKDITYHHHRRQSDALCITLNHFCIRKIPSRTAHSRSTQGTRMRRLTKCCVTKIAAAKKKLEKNHGELPSQKKRKEKRKSNSNIFDTLSMFAQKI